MSRHINHSSARFVCAALVLALASATASGQSRAANSPACTSTGPLIKVPELREGSGVAASRQSAGHFWAHNDSGEPTLALLDAQGNTVAHLRVAGATVEDWEAVAVGRCPAGTCIYIGDIGDNQAERRTVTMYRAPEPGARASSTTRADVFHLRYPDGPHDAEALLVTPEGNIFIVTKGGTGPVALYRVPPDAKPGATVTLQQIGKSRRPGKASSSERITDGAVSPNGTWIALRTNNEILLYAAKDLLSGNWRETSRVPLRSLREPQGEGITFGDDRTLYLVGEGGGKAQPGTFARLTCSL
jgi:hypothetical protein